MAALRTLHKVSYLSVVSFLTIVAVVAVCTHDLIAEGRDETASDDGAAQRLPAEDPAKEKAGRGRRGVADCRRRERRVRQRPFI